MQILLILMKVLPSVFSLMAIAERYFTAPKSGQLKKETVMAATEAIVGGIVSVSTGGQADTWTRISPFISTIVDAGSSIAFPHTPSSPDAG